MAEPWGARQIPTSANEIFSKLVRAEGWTGAQQAKIVAFGAWLGERPPPSALKDRCAQLLAGLGA